jgi:RND family efflux transporter MFP subunit
MCNSKTIAALGASCVLLVGAAALAQSGEPAQRPKGGAVQTTLVLDELATLNWIVKSDVAALREGVIEKMELQIGMPVKRNGVIGVLHHEMAELTVKKNQLQARQVAPTQKARAQKDVAAQVVARNMRLNERKPGMVSAEDVAKAEGELKVADAQILEALENTGIAEAELAMAERILAEHTILAPFDGIVLKRMKYPGESVRANESVIQLADLSKLVAETYVTIDYAYLVKEGQVVEIQPRRKDGGELPLSIGKKRFRGKITFVDPRIQPVAETAVRIRAEFENPGDLRPGLMVQMTIFLSADVAAAGPANTEPTRTARAQ